MSRVQQGRSGRCLVLVMGMAACFLCSATCWADFLADLAQPHEGRSMRATSTAKIGRDGKPDPNGRPDPNSNRDNSNVAPGQRKILLDAKGPGVITHIWMTFLGPEPHPWAKKGSANHQEMLLRMYWDGSERPAVEAPVGDFFANSFGKRSEVISLPVIVEDADSYNCFWHMPFRKSARIEIVNESEKPISLLYYNIDWIKKESLGQDTPYFYAQYRQEYPVQKGKDYVILDTEGKGHYVGTVLSVRTRSPSWFGEGDEKIYIDGEDKASIWGTGTEDYFLSAWGLKTTSTPVLRRALLRPVGHRRRPHVRLPLARHGPVGLQQGYQGDDRALGLDVARREPAVPLPQLERARGRLLQRRVLVPDRRADVHGPRPARPRAHAAEPGTDHHRGPRLHGREVSRPGRSGGPEPGPLPEWAPALQAATARERLDRDSVRGRQERAAAPAARDDRMPTTTANTRPPSTA